jgi:hypothetical protein
VRSLTGQEPLSVQDFVRNNMATFHRVCKRRLSVCGHIAPAWLREQPELLEERHVRSCASSTDHGANASASFKSRYRKSSEIDMCLSPRHRLPRISDEP